MGLAPKKKKRYISDGYLFYITCLYNIATSTSAIIINVYYRKMYV